jgi:methylmalonyl-CoA mutase N-terminal domain/subunit
MKTTPIATDHAAMETEIKDWESTEVDSFLAKQQEKRPDFFTFGGIPVKRTYTPLDLKDTDPADIGLPGRYPFTRGPYPTMYRSRTWTMRQIAGFGTGDDTNRRFKYLIAQGQTGLSTDFDMPTLMGYDSDHAMSEGEVGREGVAIDTLDDMHKLSGTIQADILKEYMAQKEYIFPIAPSVRIVRDCITYCARNMKRYNPINVSGYHISEAGSSPLHEIAFTMCNLITYVEEVTKTGMAVDEFAPRLAFFFVCQADFFEEIAKFRAARRVYAKIMHERFGAQNPESMRLRFHCQTAAATLTKPQYKINIVRTAIQALSAVLGGAQSLHTNGMDEAFSIPTEEAMKISLRTQQILAEEAHVTEVVDPIGGSYYVESLTNEYERRIFEIIDEVDKTGGTVKLIEEGWFQRHIADFSYEQALKKQSGEKPVIGINLFHEPDEKADLETHPHDPTAERRQIEGLQRVRRERDGAKVNALLDELVTVARDNQSNIMPVTIELVRAGASMGDIVERLKTLWGTYREVPVF